MIKDPKKSVEKGFKQLIAAASSFMKGLFDRAQKIVGSSKQSPEQSGSTAETTHSNATQDATSSSPLNLQVFSELTEISQTVTPTLQNKSTSKASNSIAMANPENPNNSPAPILLSNQDKEKAEKTIIAEIEAVELSQDVLSIMSDPALESRKPPKKK